MNFAIKPIQGMAKACDHFGAVTLAQAQALVADHYEAIGLYPAACGQDSLISCTIAGLGVFWILEGLAASTAPSMDLGHRMASEAMATVRGWGSPAGDTCFSDLEGDGRSAEGWIGFANAAAKAITDAGGIAGAYIGEGLGLSVGEIYALAVTRYWKSASRVPEPICAWSAVQGYPTDYVHPCGLKIDLDALWSDYRGRSVSLVVAA